MAAPLFLLAPPRSFTSVINAMIGQHPQAYGLPELNLFNFDRIIQLWQPMPDEVSFDASRCHGLLRAVAEIYVGQQTDAAIEFAEHWCGAREVCTPDAIFNEIREKIDPLITVHKSPNYALDIRRLERILHACPDARFIHLLRHPVKQCESTMKLHHGAFSLFTNAVEYQQERAILEPQLIWYDMNINILNFLEQQVPKQQSIRICGEELLEHPEATLADICRWLGIRDDTEAIDAMMHPERSPFACIGPITALFGNDPKFLKNPVFQQHMPDMPSLDAPVSWRDDGKGLYPEVIDLAKEFGYR